jgi:DnaK suppressor protein
MRRTELYKQMTQMLRRRRDALRKSLAVGQRLLTPGELRVGDSIDAAVDSEHEELNSQLTAVEHRELAAIHDALERIRHGQYGICELCDKPIPVTRLRAIPYATLCIGCQRAEESRVSRRSMPRHWEGVINEPSEEDENSTNGIELELV